EPPKPKAPPKEKPKKVEKPVKALEKGKEVKQGIVAKAQPNIPQSQTPKEGVVNGSQNGKGNVGSAKGVENGNAAKGNGSDVGNGSAASGTEINAYKSALQRALQRQANNAYPTRERMMRKMGTVTLSFTISPAGQLINVSVVSSSGNSNLDAAAVKAAQSTKTSPPPEGFPNHVTVPVKFSIE
ncbi:energy transducer TonB family protein, partial [Haemophilus parahaemolyticus]|uniref:energy transducer TonB family protein n=1 Tax=Haemophilus parahaemolyticus TaxID=735 RepID=UPI002493B2D7